jgi:hypothetical protein
VLAHNAAGPSTGTQKILERFYPGEISHDRVAPELAMLARLGATADEQKAVREQIESSGS